MAMFTVRVELHSATYIDYETLHTAMGRAGFSRTIRANNGVDYHLPTAEYNRMGYLTQAQVLEAAKVAAAQTGRRYAVLVTEAIGCLWQGLTAA